ncbi:PspA/IM30 family protein [Paenibacillus sp. SI8]|uniref:PspA/IM30 family protein n=1 Tax=unclassified Paenibacillus TaxID=185978 RepID=UPI0034656218
MKVLNRIGKMAEAAANEAAEYMDARGSGGSTAASQGMISAKERCYEEALQRAFELREQSVNAEEMAQLRGEQAELAMRAGDEELARIALQERLNQEAAAVRYRQQYASCQDEVLALAEELQQLRGARAAKAQTGGFTAPPKAGEQPRSGPHEHGARDSLRELEVAGRELGREALLGLREAGRLSRDTLKEAGGNIQQEVRALRGKLQHEWQQRRFSDDKDARGKK